MMILRRIGFWWGLAGVILFVGASAYRLTLYTLNMQSAPLFWYHWLILVLWCAYMLKAEGGAFHKSFSPRAVARAHHVRRHGDLKEIILAPFFCFGFFRASKKHLIIAYGLTVGIVIFIVLVRLLPQPWRGIVDAGAALGLSYGTLTLIYQMFKQRTRLSACAVCSDSAVSSRVE